MDVEREIQIVNAITFLVEEQSTEPVSSTIEATDEPCPAPIEGLDPAEEPVVPDEGLAKGLVEGGDAVGHEDDAEPGDPQEEELLPLERLAGGDVLLVGGDLLLL